LFTEFALKLADLWRYEGGVAFRRLAGDWNGWEHFRSRHARGRGVLLVTPHLGNWEFGGAFMVAARLQTARADAARTRPHLTAMRQVSRARGASKRWSSVRMRSRSSKSSGVAGKARPLRCLWIVRPRRRR
jgi:lauroyl/myristoyl acyltransferase